MRGESRCQGFRAVSTAMATVGLESGKTPVRNDQRLTPHPTRFAGHLLPQGEKENAGPTRPQHPHFHHPMHCRTTARQKLSSIFATALAPPVSFSHPVAREGRSAGDLAAAGCDRAGYSGGADYSPGPGHGALSMPARPGPKHRLAPKTRAHRGLWQNGHAGRQPSSKRYFYFPTPGVGPAPRSLPITPHRRALQPVRRLVLSNGARARSSSEGPRPER